MTAWTLAGPTCQWSGREEVNATAGAWSQSVGPVDGWRRMVCERIRILNLRRFLRGIYEARQSRGTRHALNCTAPSDARFQIRGVTVGPPEWARRASVWTEQAVLLRTTRNKTDGRWQNSWNGGAWNFGLITEGRFAVVQLGHLYECTGGGRIAGPHGARDPPRWLDVVAPPTPALRLRDHALRCPLASLVVHAARAPVRPWPTEVARAPASSASPRSASRW
jgi:hypothetical protein